MQRAGDLAVQLIAMVAFARPLDECAQVGDAAGQFVGKGSPQSGVDAVGHWPGFASTGTGMGGTLQVAGERRAYVLSDLGTFLAFAQRVQLEALTESTPDLRNVYSVLRIDPERFPGRVNGEGAQRFEAFLLDPDTQRRIDAFGRERFGRPLFRPLHLED